MKEKNKYVNINIVKATIEELLNLNSYDDLRKIIEDINVNVTEEEIKKFLINNSLDKSNSYNDFAIKYYKKHIEILKEKIYKLLDIINDIENIFNENYSYNKKIDVINYLSDFGIVLKKNNRLLKRKDAIRIIIPILENYEKLIEIEEKANNLDSYIEFKLTENFTSETGLREDEIYPDSNLQIKNLDYININSEFGYIPLSKKQKKLIKERDNKFTYIVTNNLKDMK